MTPSSPETPPKPIRLAPRPKGPLIAATIAAIGVFAALYGIGGQRGNALPKICEPSRTRAATLDKLASGPLAAVAVAKQPQPAPPLSFLTPDGQVKTLADFRGRTVLLNLWATWCVPCRQEMPALDALQGTLGAKDFEVVAVNIDTRNPERAKAWLEEAKIGKLAYYADPSAKIFQDLKSAGKAFGMPTTLLIDRNGCEIANLAGPAEWAGEEALAFIREALRQP